MGHINVLTVAVSAAILLSITACGSTSSKTEGSSLEIQKEELALREAELNRRAVELSSRESRLGTASAVTPVAGGEELLPPNAKAGECYTRVWQPPEYRSKTDRKLVAEASERIEIIPAKYGKTSKRTLIQEASTKLVAVPATYKTVTERILVQPARSELVQIPATYETVTEKVIDKPAHTTWKKGRGPIQRIDDTTGEIMCLIEVPATYKTIQRKVLKRAASVQTKEIPAKYKTVQKRVVATPATTRTVEIPAKYGSLSVVEEIQPAQQRRIVIPAKYTQVNQTELVADGKMQWREIMCETNTTPSRIATIQTALKDAGFNPGPIDGDIGSSTMSAVNAFQRSKGLPVDQYLNVATVRALGVSHR